MMDYTKIPANLMPDAVWGVDVATYTYVPFFPVSENAGINPEKPFVTYQSMPRLRQGSGETDYWLKKERMIYTVVAPMPNVMYISNFIAANTSKFDVSARAINDHVADEAVIFDIVRSFSVDLIDETTKYDSVSPRYTAEIIVDFDYRRSDDDE
jgi:hypothetical protein